MHSFLFVPLLTLGSLQVQVARSSTEFTTKYPSIKLDYKIELGPGKEECFFQYIMQGSAIYIEFAVIKGGDGRAGFKVAEPNGMVVLPYEWTARTSWETQGARDGPYQFCLDNRASTITSKVIGVFLHSHFIEDSELYIREIAELHLIDANFSQILSNVDGNLASVQKQLHQSRTSDYRDLSMGRDNQDYVTFWSLLQCFAILITGTCQIFYIRKLFDVPSPSVYRKPTLYPIPQAFPVH